MSCNKRTEHALVTSRLTFNLADMRCRLTATFPPTAKQAYDVHASVFPPTLLHHRPRSSSCSFLASPVSSRCILHLSFELPPPPPLLPPPPHYRPSCDSCISQHPAP